MLLVAEKARTPVGAALLAKPKLDMVARAAAAMLICMVSESGWRKSLSETASFRPQQL